MKNRSGRSPATAKNDKIARNIEKWLKFKSWTTNGLANSWRRHLLQGLIPHFDFPQFSVRILLKQRGRAIGTAALALWHWFFWNGQKSEMCIFFFTGCSFVGVYQKFTPITSPIIKTNPKDIIVPLSHSICVSQKNVTNSLQILLTS